MALGYRIKEDGLGALPMSCKICDANEVYPEDSGIHYNEGDSLIPAHLHVNLIYRCAACQGRFAVRGHLFPQRLYYGDITADGVVVDDAQGAYGQDDVLRAGESIIEAVRTAARAEKPVVAEAVPWE
ncbi:hypothetical protein LCGC14_1954410 [marine sediment metagenome]|uniref:Uncharacterized protein n=1 Tax=marine sediment metagenome TaxID=412755 RepID=A0A0F9IDK7_9ZZZZ